MKLEHKIAIIGVLAACSVWILAYLVNLYGLEFLHLVERPRGKVVEWQTLSLTVPRMWYAYSREPGEWLPLSMDKYSVHEDKGWLSMDRQVSSKTHPEGFTIFTINFFKGSHSEEVDRKIDVYDKVFWKCRVEGTREELNIDGVIINLSVLPGEDSRVYGVGSIPPEQIRFYADIEDEKTIYQILRSIKLKDVSNH